jgi:hypothetical protein
MTDELRDKYYGYTISESIALTPGELPIDAVGLWQIVPDGRDGFGLSGEALDDFIRRTITALLDADAVPVRHVPGSQFEWDVQHQYGTTREQIIEGIIAEWHTMPDDPLVLCGEGVWFARPRPGRKYVKID